MSCPAERSAPTVIDGLTAFAKKSDAPPAWDVTEKDLRLLQQMLRLRFPTDLSVRFRSHKFPAGDWGDCGVVQPRKEGAQSYILIRVNRDMPNAMKWLITIHEYAHARQQRGDTVEAHRLADHDGEWGVNEADLWNEFGG